MKKAVFMAMAALTVAALSTGCIGKFRLTNNILAWNEGMHEEAWVQEVVFLGLHIVPVYQISIFADIILFNSIEFWTDKPIDFLAGVDQQGNEDKVVSNGDGTATLHYKGQLCTLVKQGSEVKMVKDGAYVGTFSAQGSLVSFTAPDGSVQSVLR